MTVAAKRELRDSLTAIRLTAARFGWAEIPVAQLKRAVDLLDEEIADLAPKRKGRAA